MDNLHNLEEFWFNSNLIDDWHELDHIAKLQLTTIYLEHNPISSDKQYRNKLLAIFPGLTQIDAIVVTRPSIVAKK